MIIFNFGPFSKDELTIRLDREGGIEFLGVVSGFLNKCSDAAVIDCLHYTGHLIDSAEMELRRGGENILEVKSEKITLCMSVEALEYAQFLLQKFLVEGDFSPPEFYSFARKNRKYDTQVFFLKFVSIASMVSDNGRR